MSKNLRVAIVGATGAVGIELLAVMEKRNFPASSIRLLASPKSAGRTIPFRGHELTVEPLQVNSFTETDLAFFSAGATISREFVPIAVKSGAIVVDNSSAFRANEQVPLVVPEINGHKIKNHKGIIANPNCTTAITLMALAPLHQTFGLTRIFASSYQAVSGAGARAIEELKSQSKDALSKKEPLSPEVFPHPIAFNLIPQIDSFTETGYTKEEIKMQNEARRILDLPTLLASVTCVRVPVFRAHSIAVTAEFERPVDIRRARHAIESFPGIQLLDDPDSAAYPMPIFCAGKDDCFAGRLRKDCALDNGLSLWICGDQLLRGAALNAVLIAEKALSLK